MKSKSNYFEPYVFNPWQRVKLSETLMLPHEPSNLGEGENSTQPMLEIASDAIWKQPIRWNKKLAMDEFFCPAVLGSTCDWCDSEVQSETRERLWKIIDRTPFLDWFLVSRRATDILTCLPMDWGYGYDNVALGVHVERGEDLSQVNSLTKIRAEQRFIVVSPNFTKVGALNLRGIHFVMVRTPSSDVGQHLNEKWYRELKDHCKTKGVPLKIVRAQ